MLEGTVKTVDAVAKLFERDNLSLILYGSSQSNNFMYGHARIDVF